MSFREPTTTEEYLNLATEKFQGAKGMFTNREMDPTGRNSAQMLCLSVELTLNALILHHGTTPPKTHELAKKYQLNLDHDLPSEYESLLYELDGMYTQLRYDADADIQNLGDKLTTGERFIQYAVDHIHAQDDE